MWGFECLRLESHMSDWTAPRTGCPVHSVSHRAPAHMKSKSCHLVSPNSNWAAVGLLSLRQLPNKYWAAVRTSEFLVWCHGSIPIANTHAILNEDVRVWAAEGWGGVKPDNIFKQQTPDTANEILPHQQPPYPSRLM
eukprot:c24893_g5_i4 orf=122-532(+)